MLVSDATLRDGNHAASQKLDFGASSEFIATLDMSGAGWIEVGHGNGLGASSLNFGESNFPDEEILSRARASISRALLSVHVMPGIATFNNNIKPAIEIGVDVFRVASHCTEADTTTGMISRIANEGSRAVGVLMMTHRLDPKGLATQAKLMFEAGAEAVILMDSAGALTSDDVRNRIDALVQLGVGKAGFHGHNNLGLALWNTIEAARAGASILDSTVLGFGAGAGNCQTELLHSIMRDYGFESGLTDSIFDAVRVAQRDLGVIAPSPSTLSVLTGKFGIFSGFSRQIKHASKIFAVSEGQLCKELSQYETVAGQEDLVYELAEKLSRGTSEENNPGPSRGD